jgi:glucose/mannose-6-phosphate isomerase
MNLDSIDSFQALDSENILARIDPWPEAVEEAWAFGQTQTVPAAPADCNHVVLAGAGALALGGRVAQMLSTTSAIPITCASDYELPAGVGPHTLILALSATGQTEETAHFCQRARERGARVLTIAPEGDWRYSFSPSFGLSTASAALLCLAALTHLRLIADPTEAVTKAARALRAQREIIRAASPIHRNPAKRMAGQLMERFAVLLASAPMAVAAEFWSASIALTAKAWAQANVVPDMTHHQLAGSMQPETLINKYMVLTLRAASDHPRNQQRLAFARTVYMTSGFNTDSIEATGDGRLAHALTLMQYGDYAAYYLAMSYGVDPAGLEEDAVQRGLED